MSFFIFASEAPKHSVLEFHDHTLNEIMMMFKELMSVLFLFRS